MTTTAGTPKPRSRQQEKLAKPFIRLFSAANTALYRISGGRFGAKWTHGEAILLLTTTGRKTGKRRTVPLVFMPDGDRMIVVASQAGMSTDPHWFGNAVANPDVEVEIGRTKTRMRARRGTADEKTRYWPQLCAMNQDYVDYQARTTRDIPILILEPA